MSVKKRKEEIIKNIVESSSHFTDEIHEKYKEKMVSILLEYSESFLEFWRNIACKADLQDDEDCEKLGKDLFNFVEGYVQKRFVKE